MILIAHRGNTNGPNTVMENNPEYIKETMKKGFDVETDVWFEDGEFLLGHNFPFYKVSYIFLKNDKLWCHAKNISALIKMLEIGGIHCFWHENDKVTLTSKNYIWTYPGEELTSRSIACLPENSTFKNIEVSKGICSDYILNYSL
jgi:hypothetical protein